MERKEALQLIKRTQDLYPNSKFNDEIIIIWRDYLEQCDFKKSNERLTSYYLKSKFKPHVTEIGVRNEINIAMLESEQIQRDIKSNTKTANYDDCFRDLNKLKESLRNELYT